VLRVLGCGTGVGVRDGVVGILHTVAKHTRDHAQAYQDDLVVENHFEEVWRLVMIRLMLSRKTLSFWVLDD
jgi:hypothetical protein